MLFVEMKGSTEETEALQLVAFFHSLYQTLHLISNDKRHVQRRDKIHRPKSRPKTGTVLYSSTGVLPFDVPRIEILGNCSSFSSYASIRQLVLELTFAEESKKWLINQEDHDNENDNVAERLPSPIAVPKVVGLGLETVFQLVKESKGKQSSICIKALEALLNILGGQYPQSLRKEPLPVIESLFSTLLGLSKVDVFDSEAPNSSNAQSSEQLTSLATACLISLAIARGETKMMLEAISSLFICPERLATQTFQSPDILKALQRSTQAVLVGRPTLPQWLSHGIPTNSCVDSFAVNFPPDPPGSVFSAKSLASDGRYLYLHCSRGIYKIGSGCFGTVRGHIYASATNFHPSEKVWLGWASGKLFCRLVNSGDLYLKVLNEDTFEVKESIKTLENGSFSMFSDGLHVGAIVPSKDDGFLARTVWMETANMSWDSFFEISLRLVKKSLEVSGPCPWDNETYPRSIVTGIDEDVVTICAGKDFALLRTQHGRILYCGKGASLGQKSGITKCSKWLELGLTKCPRFTQCAVGHEGIHALLLTEDGTAYFVGTPKRGEDGDQAKPRRVAKASKPKKVIRMEGYEVTSVACNNGTSAFITKTGDVYMFGKDTAHCDPATGAVLAMRGIFVAQMAMGKAHSVFLSVDGKVYTMGINNRGQCGRTWTPRSPHKDAGTDVLEDDDGEWEDAAAAVAVVPPEQEGMCPAGSHRWKHEQCMICTVCRECTGYGSACISALRPDRNPGQECGCGVGDAGCAECGSCRTCAREGIDDQDYVIIDAQRVLDPVAGDILHLEDDRVIALDEQPEKRPVKSTSSGKTGKTRGSSKENSMTSFPPSRLNLPVAYPVIQVACGLHHTVILDSVGIVFVCGSNSFGQLGVGDLTPRHTPCKARFPDPDTKIIQIAAGSYHTVALDSNGIVYTCGSHAKGQLAREPDETKTDSFWFARMVALPNVGSKCGRRATWISASGDATFMKFEVSLISPKMLQKSTVTANSSSIMIIPPFNAGKTTSIIMINRKDGCCSYFDGEKNLVLATTAATLDPVYDFLWAYEWKTHTMKCHNVIASAIRNRDVEANNWLTKPPYAVPISPNAKLQRWQAGANLLACIDSLIAAHIQGLSVAHEEQTVVTVLSKMYSRDDYSAVCRFESHGGGWGYSGHSIEAIRFSCDSDIVVGGFGLFGGRGEYCAKIKIFDLGPEGGENEGDGELLVETEEVPYECGPRQKFRLMFEDAVPLQGGRWYLAWSHISGPSSDCGSSGQTVVVTEDQVTFHFKSSKKSNNGTDVNAGQIPQILYRLMTSDPSGLGSKPNHQSEPTYLLSNDFISMFSHMSIQTLMGLVTWCWEEIQLFSSSSDIDTFKAELMEFVISCSLRLIDFSINQAYPLKGCNRLTTSESTCTAEAVGEIRTTIQAMISSKIECKDAGTLDQTLENVLQQTSRTFVNCFQIFYPTSILKWECLSHFMQLYFDEPEKYSRTLSAILEALCTCRGHLLGVFPVLNGITRNDFENSRRPFAFNHESPNRSRPSKNHVLINQMAARNDVEGFTRSDWTFWEVLENLLTIINLDGGKAEPLVKSLVYNSCILLARLMEELVSHASGAYAELENVLGQLVLISPSRFTRTNQSRTWNTGNGSPDAVSFTTDQPGVTIFGACVYTGTGGYEYEMDILQEADEPGDNGDQQNSKWTTLESVRGSFESDDSYGEIFDIKFQRSVHLKVGTKYAIRLKNHGARTCNGDGGITILRCPDGTVFTFSSCSLSFNGTNQIRGQIPHLLYFRHPEDSESRLKTKAVGEMQARKCAQRMNNAIFESAKSVFDAACTPDINELSKSCLVNTLFPSILSHLPRLAISNIRSCVDLLKQIRVILPSVSDLNNRLLDPEHEKTDILGDAVHFAWVESEHPYKPAVVTHYRVNFPPTVQMMAIEFDPRCSTAQPEDGVRLYIPKNSSKNMDSPFHQTLSSLETTQDNRQDSLCNYIAILQRYTGREDWPKKAIILPGNEVLFSLETASDYTRAEKDHYFGFRCLVSGFEISVQEGLHRLEMELAYLGGLCAFELVKKDIVLPPVSAEEVEASTESKSSDDKMMEICNKHQQLFAKGIGLEHFPDVHEALDGIVPLREKSKEREFVTNFVARTPNTSGERLANWLQPESFVDPHKCEILIPEDKIKRGVLTSFTLVTRDQYTDLVFAPNLQVEVKAVPMTSSPSDHPNNPLVPVKVSNFKFPKIKSSYRRAMLDTFPGNVTTPYQSTVKDKMRYHAITMMKDYEHLSFEELRLLSPLTFRSSESMLVRQCNNGTYTAAWNPSGTGMYNICATVDGYSLAEICVVNVDENNEKSFSCLRTMEDSTESTEQHLLRKRKFKTTNSAGLRIRCHPSLQSEQIGVVPVNGVIEFTQEVQNDDGIWVKLDESSLYAYCEGTQPQTRNFRVEGWCLQYNQHVGRTLLFPIETPKRLSNNRYHEKGPVSLRRRNDPVLTNSDGSSKILRLNGSPGIYQVVKCGVSGHNIRSRPCLRSPPVGILVMGSRFTVVDECVNNEGLWVKLDSPSQRKFCFTSEGEAWSLAVGNGDVTYLRHLDSSMNEKGYDFSIAAQYPQNVFQSVSPPAAFVGPAEIPMNIDLELKSSVPLLSQSPDKEREILDKNPKASPSEIFKDSTESPPATVSTPITSSPTSTSLKSNQSRSSSRRGSETAVEPPKPTPRKTSTPLGALQKWLSIGGSGSDSRQGSSSPMKQATSVMEVSKSLVKERIGVFGGGGDKTKAAAPPPATTCSATQTSPDEQSVFPSGKHFSMGPNSTTGGLPVFPGGADKAAAKASPKSERKKRGNSKSRSSYRERERLRSPPRGFERGGETPFPTHVTEPPEKVAIGPGQAQSLRAVFGAILSHSELTHDAMACASYLRFITKDAREETTCQKLQDSVSPQEADGETTKSRRSSGKTAGEESTSLEETKLPVVMRKKHGSPARSKSWRHSLEVTTPSRYLKDASSLKLAPLDSSPIQSDSNTDDQNHPPADASDDQRDPNLLTQSVPDTKEQLPFAMIALSEIWKYVTNNCSDIIFDEKDVTAVEPKAHMTPQLAREASERRNTSYTGFKTRSDRPHLQPNEPDDDQNCRDNIQKCELCCSGFKSKAKSRKAHFGFTSLCENCSERQLKLKKRHQIGWKVPAGTHSVEPTTKFTLPEEQEYNYSSLLNNALFLLQMTNGCDEGQIQSQGLGNGQKSGFCCLKALGISGSQITDDDDAFYDLKSPVAMRDFAEAVALKERRAILAVSTSFADDEWDPFTSKRRKGSNGDQISDENVGFTLLNHPSAPLQKLLNLSSSGAPVPEKDAIQKMCSTVLSFVTEQHDLNGLKLFLFQAIRKITCRSYGMQMLAWLLRNLSLPAALHDVLWWYASSLEYKGENFTTLGTVGLDNGWWLMRRHPLSESPSAIFPVLSESFYHLMQTIADLMPFLPVGSPLLEMAVKCWGVSFTRKDHQFLHRSKIFRNLSKIMSQFDGEMDWSKNSLMLQLESSEQAKAQQVVSSLNDLTQAMEVKVSSRAALCSSLTDECTETFWESGDEDRNRTKCLTIVSTCEAIISVVAIHIDNGRDNQYKVSSITVKGGSHPDECIKIGQSELDSRHCGWVWFFITLDNIKIIKVEAKGPDNTLRIRQVKVLGVLTGEEIVNEKAFDRSLEYTPIIAQRKCENETLRIFRLLSSEVFGKFLYGMRRGECDVDGNDLEEHVVGILFSRNKLTHLQKQVCSHIVAAIHREAIKIKEEMESQLVGTVLEAAPESIRLINQEKPRIPDRYCFEMLTLVLALADHKLGRSYLSQQSNLIQDLMQLFHSGTPRIQRQVIAVVKKILPEIKPEHFLTIVNQYDSPDKLGILDLFFGCILKALQVKVRGSQDGNRSAKNISITDILIAEELPPHYWFFRGDGDLQLANSVVSLIKEMCEDSFSPDWAPMTKSAIADGVLYLTRVDEKCRRAAECLNSPRFWISLAALSTLHPDHSKLLSSPVFSNGNSGRTKCINHDDGETLAVLQCHECGDLCTECDRILHLPKKCWNHVRKVCKEEEESIKVDLHEGCGRIKLFWLTALVDSSTLKALVEFRNGMPKTVTDAGSVVTAVGRCRFCDKVGNSGPLALGNVCGDKECQEYAKIACERILECTHLCGGVRNETKCLPCLQGCSDTLGTILKQDGDDMCMICFTDALAFAPAVQLSCGHVFHYHCCRSILESRWAGPRISFSFSLCPICKVQMSHELLDDVLLPIRDLFDDVRRKALMRLEYEGLNQADEIASPGGRYFHDPAGYAMDRYAYYVCFKCKKPYFGGEARCDADVQLDYDPTELLCGGCSDVSQAQLCPKHGTDYLEYKCRYCCSVAVFFCFGTTHFCNGCHDDFQRITAIPKHQLPQCPAGPRARQLEGEECPLHVTHPSTGEEFALGCGICRNAHTF